MERINVEWPIRISSFVQWWALGMDAPRWKRNDEAESLGGCDAALQVSKVRKQSKFQAPKIAELLLKTTIIRTLLLLFFVV